MTTILLLFTVLMSLCYNMEKPVWTPIFLEYRMTLSVQYSKYFQDQADACKPNSPIWILQYYFVEILTLGGRGISRLNFNSMNFIFGWEGDFYMSSRFMFQFQTRFARQVQIFRHNSVHSLYFATVVFALFLGEIFIKFETQWQFWNLLVMRIPKHPQHAQFDEVLAEIFDVKDNWYHPKKKLISSQLSLLLRKWSLAFNLEYLVISSSN